MSAAHSLTPLDRAFQQAAARSTIVLAPMATERPDGWPLLIQDVGEVPGAPPFLARCRWCGWASPRQATPDRALAAFAAHLCQERPS
jgi:hypothetical protein